MTETELLFSEILNCNRQDLYLNKNILLGKEKSALIAAALKRRISGEPLEYILGSADFMGLKFKVTPDVLIPRPETEILVEKTIEKVWPFAPRPSSLNILDIGTGSGCIAIALAKLIPQAQITAMDISEQALQVARENSTLNGVKVDFFQGDFFTAHNLRPMAYGLIVSNPPYIASADIAALQPEVQYEPEIALDGGEDGLDFYRRMAELAPVYLKPGGLLIMEIGFRQRQAVEKILLGAGKFFILEVIKDYRNIERVLVAKRTS